MIDYPIVFSVVNDPAGQGFVASLARNLTIAARYR
jgi:hypothetical protein